MVIISTIFNNKEISLFQYLMPILGFVSGSILHIVIVDLYNILFLNKYSLYTFNLRKLNNFSGYMGLILGLNYLNTGKPLFIV